ncbi:Ser/Thr protein kinase RdoA involved in Cpx stress response, MazF antagonist [Actinomyces ruminicola]|uniref:Ser/Thr protein kinase RdoA involved in Cpx stress response, MazF antagonist n=1 Tax=Actinomyces ruminicola TaxID=332524 RepID=A0A1H0BUR7_9ACTO|nr:aminoglycoside phosphotransferase family protein [Actinomyces ruminicola]SDN49348.1 Ser/Thr protein kinase RdoA involved in Cpx stress response, MazF antagonist [Actinomyces ruminicola]
MFISSTRSAVDAVLDPDRLSQLVGAPVRAARLRIKPGVSVTASLLEADSGRSAGWARLLWPGSRVKAAKAARRGAHLGLRTRQHDTDDGLLLQVGEVAADPALVKHIARAREIGLLDTLEGNLLRYNPQRRLVVRTPRGVVRVTAASQHRALALQDFAAGHLSVPPPLPTPGHADDAHLSVQAFVGDTDLERHHDPAATARVGAALAALHAATTDLPAALHNQLETTCPGPRALALAHAQVLCHLDPTLAARVRRLGQALAPESALSPQGLPVLCHGDASPDQVLVEQASGRIWLTDFDRARLAPAAVDLGSYLAVADPASGQALLAGYADAGGRVPPADELRAAIARARLARIQDPLRHGDQQWRRRLAAEIDRIERLLAPARRTHDRAADAAGCSREAS